MMLERINKFSGIILVITTLSYLFGFVVVTTYLTRFAIVDSTLFTVEYLKTGFCSAFLLSPLLAIIYIEIPHLFLSKKKEEQFLLLPGKTRRFEGIADGLTLTPSKSAGYYKRIVGAIKVNPDNQIFISVFYVSSLLVIGLLVFEVDFDEERVMTAYFITPLLFGLVTLISVVTNNVRWGSRFLVGCMVFPAVSLWLGKFDQLSSYFGLMTLNYFGVILVKRAWKDRLLVIGGCLCFSLVSALPLLGTSVLSGVFRSFGGLLPTSKTLVIDTENYPSSNSTISSIRFDTLDKVKVLHENSESVFFIQADHPKRVNKISKSIIMLEVTEEKWSSNSIDEKIRDFLVRLRNKINQGPTKE